MHLASLFSKQFTCCKHLQFAILKTWKSVVQISDIKKNTSIEYSTSGSCFCFNIWGLDYTVLASEFLLYI